MRWFNFLCIVTYLLLPYPVKAHDWYPEICCSKHDCHPVPCNELDIKSDKHVVYGSYVFTGKQVWQSKDGECHVCIHENIGYSKWPVCVFIQNNM